jgi:sulfate permease, SulP family
VAGAVSMHPRKPHPPWVGAAGAARATVLARVLAAVRAAVRAARDLGARADLRGGITAGVLTLVTAIAYAALASAPLDAGLTSAAAMSGLIGAAAGGLVAAALGPVKTMVFSPRASVAVVIASAATSLHAQLGPAAITQTLGWLSACLLLASLMQAGFGLLRLGALIRLIPHCVTAGFMVGIAIEMAWSQWPHLWPAGAAATQLSAHAPLVIGLACVGAIACVQWHPRWQRLRGWAMPIGLVVAVLFCEGLQTMLSWTVPHLRAVDFSTPPFVSLMQAVGLTRNGPAAALLPQMLVFALVIAFVNSIETLTCVLALETRLQQRFDANRALMASAAGSLAAVCLGGLPVAGGTAASIANVDAGGRSRGSAITAALTVALLAAAGHQVIDRIPLAAVAGVALTVAFALALGPVREMALQRRATSSELAVACLVGLLLLCVGSAVALVCGVLAVSVLAMMQMRRSVVRRDCDASQVLTSNDNQLCIEPSFARKIRVLEVGQPLLFATVESVVQAIDAHRETVRQTVRQTVQQTVQQTVRFVVLDLSHVTALDASAARTLAACAVAMTAENQTLLIVRPSREPAALRAIDGCDHFDSVADALRRCVAVLQQPLEGCDPMPPLPPDVDGTPPNEAARATRLLAQYVGPIARVLVQQACAHSSNRQQLYGLLAQHLPNRQSSQAFLDAAGLGPEPLAPGASR